MRYFSSVKQLANVYQDLCLKLIICFRRIVSPPPLDGQVCFVSSQEEMIWRASRTVGLGNIVAITMKSLSDTPDMGNPEQLTKTSKKALKRRL